MLFCGVGRFSVDFVEYEFYGNSVLFLSPYQNFKWLADGSIEVVLLRFHSDFYCIEYHKKEVACNGLLFNNIYLLPNISVGQNVYSDIKNILNKMEYECDSKDPYSNAILRSYLQLILAICSKEKSRYLASSDTNILTDSSDIIVEFQKILEENFHKERTPAFYASKLAISANAFSKKIKTHFNKTPSQIIQERVGLEAKKLLHLTHKSIKEIAFELNFEDEFYFSRYFKKIVGKSPLHYREYVGISTVAK